MENTEFNGTATKDQEDWKKKKGYGSIIVAVSLTLLLGLSFHTVGHLESGTKEMQSVAASSSTMSLVSSTTAASASKTLTIELDDDEDIDVLLSGWTRAEQPMGGSSSHCQKNTGYNCGAVFPPDGNTCGQKGCCCRQEDGTGYKMNTCDNAKGYAYRGCNSCLGYLACFKTNNIEVGDSSCHGKNSCNSVSDSTIDNGSCHSKNGSGACMNVQNSIIHKGSCQGAQACYGVQHSIIGEGSCNGGSGQDGNGNVDGDNCHGSQNITIGNNSCNQLHGIKNSSICYRCKHNVPDNACNEGSTDDLTDGYCNYCGENFWWDK